jgi:hypothetical protein
VKGALNPVITPRIDPAREECLLERRELAERCGDRQNACLVF